jgi:hypothetical protein
MSTKSPSLFDDDAEFVATRTALARRANPLGASKKAKSVNRLLQQVESLRQRFEKEKRRLDEALIFHAGHLRHRYDRVAALRADGVRGLARFLDDPRIGKADRRNLREFLKEQLQGVLTHVQVPDQEITDLFERLHGVSYEEAAASDMELMRSEMGAMFESLGLDLEMPEMRPDMSEEEIAQEAARLAEQFNQQQQAWTERESARRKTKRELREEARAERRERAHKLSLGAIYKRLVKTLHPDLERDPALRERKSAVMQEVTAAYAAKDLPALLRFELEWIDGDVVDAARKTDETLNAYAELLREQITQLRLELADLPFHPRYADLMPANDPFGVPGEIDGPAEVQRLDQVIASLTAGLERLADPGTALTEVPGLLREYKAQLRQARHAFGRRARF